MVGMKTASLVVLTIQNTLLVTVMKISKSHAYINSTAVFHMEFLKLFVCLTISFFQNLFVEMRHPLDYAKKNDLEETPPSTPDDFAHQPPQQDIFDGHFWKLSVPALLYFIQNNLLYVAIENLDSLTFQLLYQLKIITTALFSVAMLGRSLSRLKWFSLLVLFIGVVFVQSNPPKDYSAADDISAPSPSAGDDASSSSFVGVLAVLVSSITSGFSGVYFEKILKSAGTTSIWHRNIQLGLFSCFFATLNLFLVDHARIKRFGFFFDYSPIVWVVVVNQALGGLVVALVVKYADNILKGFATSASIILSGVIGVIWLGLRLNLWFLFGASLVISAVYLYSVPAGGNVDLRKSGKLESRPPEVIQKNVRYKP